MDVVSEDCYTISDNDSSSDVSIGNGYFSDNVDSEIEARLYSCIHHHSSLDNSNDSYSDSSSRNDSMTEANLTGQTHYLPNQHSSKRSNLSLNQKTSNCDDSSSESQRLRENKKVRSAPGEFYIDPDTEDYNSDDELTDDPEYWKVGVKDLMKNTKGRYYRKEKYCERCKKFCHHTIALCPLPKKVVCHYCVRNHHVSRCSIFCDVCGFEHHPLKCQEKYKLHCKLCNYLGHDETNCPLHWLKYALTTMPYGIPLYNKESLNTKKSCPNCAANHYVFECKESFIDDIIKTDSQFVSDSFKSEQYLEPENEKLSDVQSYDNLVNKKNKKKKKKKVYLRSYTKMSSNRRIKEIKNRNKEIKRLNNLDLFGKLKKSLEDEITDARRKNDRKRAKKLTLRKTKVIEIMKEIRKEKSLVDHYKKKKVLKIRTINNV